MKGFTGRVFAALLAATGTLVLVAPAQAAPPPNDGFENAAAISSLPSTTNGTLAESTIQTPDEPNHAGSIFVVPTQSVWYEWTSPGTTSKVKFSACPAPITGSTPGVAIYTGSALNSLTLVTTSGSNTLDNERDCSVKLVAAPSTTYKVAIYNKHTSFNNVVLGAFQLLLRALNPPANDDFAAAASITSSLPQTLNGTNVDATGESGEPGHFAGSARASVWYSWTATADIPVRINACQNNGPEPTVIAVYTGSAVNALTTVAHFQSCRAYFEAMNGQTYKIAADLLAGNSPEGPFSMLVRQANLPLNDDLADAQVITGDSIQNVAGTTVDATTEPSEPNHIVSGGPPGPPDIGPPASVWFSWTSGASGGSVSIDGCDPAGGAIAVYTGDSYSDPLVPVIPINGSCTQTFTAAPSTTYKIAVEGLGDGAPFVLNPPASPPSGGNQTPTPAPAPPGATGRRAAALKKCKKKRGKARKKCVKRAKRLPV